MHTTRPLTTLVRTRLSGGTPRLVVTALIEKMAAGTTTTLVATAEEAVAVKAAAVAVAVTKVAAAAHAASSGRALHTRRCGRGRRASSARGGASRSNQSQRRRLKPAWLTWKRARPPKRRLPQKPFDSAWPLGKPHTRELKRRPQQQPQRHQLERRMGQRLVLPKLNMLRKQLPHVYQVNVWKLLVLQWRLPMQRAQKPPLRTPKLKWQRLCSQ